MTETAETYPVPTTQEAEDALIKALSTRTVQKLEQAKAMFEGPAYDAFRAELDALVELKVPAALATAQNVANLSNFLSNMQRVVQQDLDNANAVITPPPPPPVAPSIPSVG